MDILKFKQSTKLKRTFVMLLLWMLVMSSLTGCDNRAEGEALARAGQTTSETIAKYYETLIQDTYDTWDYKAFLIGKDLGPNDQPRLPDAAGYTTRIQELKKRIKVARTMADTYKALEDLSVYDASGEISKSAGELKESLEGLGVLDPAVIPTQLFTMVIADLAKWKQSKDIRKGSALISAILQQFYEMFSRESSVYQSFVDEKGTQVTIIAQYLINEQKVTSLALLQKIPDNFGLKLVGADTPVARDSSLAKALIAMVRVRGERITNMSGQAAGGIQQAIVVLIANHRQLQEKRGLTLSSLMEGLERAKAYIDEINKIREGNAKNKEK